jgi:hypothetical protein
MPRFKDDSGTYYPGADEGAGNYNMVEDLLGRFAEGANQPLSERMSNINKYNERKTGPIDELRKIPSRSSSKTSDLGMNPDIASLLSSRSPKPPMAMAPTPKAVKRVVAESIPMVPAKRMYSLSPDMNSKAMPSRSPETPLGLMPMGSLEAPPELMSSPASMPNAAMPDMSKMAGSIPKTKSGMKKFMDEYGKFIALGALAGVGGKKGMIAAPIMAALPGILKMLQNRGKKTPGAPAGTPAVPPVDTLNVAHGGLLGNKSAAHPKKKMAGGSIRKFSGGVMKKGIKKFADGGESKSDKRESAFNRLTPQYGAGFAALGTSTPLRKDSISKKLLKEEDIRYRPFSDSEEETNDKDMKMALASIIDEMYNAKNRMPAKGGVLDEYKMFDSKEYERPIVSEIYDKKYRSTAGVPYDSPSFKARQARQINPSVKVSGDKTPKKMVGGTVRKFKGGSMNTMKDNLMPKYKKGGNMPKGMPKEMMAMMGKKGKATGDMPERKKMDMGMPIGNMPDPKKMGMAKPKPSSMDQKFAKGGTARYASGGMCKGNGIAKKIRATGVMN